MTADLDPRDEARLKRLFDASAPEASGPTLTKLRARAREVPERTLRTPRWMPRWAWSPLLAGFAAGAGALAVTIGVWVGSADDAMPSRPSSSDAPAAQQPGPVPESPVARSSAPLLEADSPSSEDFVLDESAELAADFDLDVDQSYLDFDPIEDPLDEELEAWWLATEDLLEGGG